jgi:hypothetical protein
MSRRNLWILLVASISLVGALTFVVSDRRISRASDLNEVAASVFSQSRILRENTRGIGADQASQLDLLAPATLTSTDLANVVKSIAGALDLRMMEITSQVAPISRDDALVAINLEPSIFPDFFTVVTASVKVTGDIPRLMELLKNLKAASAKGPLRGFVELKFNLNGGDSMLSLGLVGIRFNGGSRTPTTSTTDGVLSSTTLPSDTTVAP